MADPILDADVLTQEVVPSESAGTQTAAGSPSEVPGAVEAPTADAVVAETQAVEATTEVAVELEQPAPADETAAPVPPPTASAPNPVQETAETADTTGLEPDESSPETAEATPGASPEQSAAVEVPSTPDQGYLGHAPGDVEFVPGSTNLTDHSSGAHAQALAQGYVGQRAGEKVDTIVGGRHVVLPASAVTVDQPTEDVPEQ